MAGQGQIRIIGGQWRGRKLKVPDREDLRPTPDRVRETIFNWLADTIQGACCLDPYAGSGALGFEALSRGAAYVVMVDRSSDIVKLLEEELRLFKAENAEIYCANAPNQLKRPKKLFDIVFLDPPFQENILLPTCFYLEENLFLAPSAYIYMESGSIINPNELPPNWKLLKAKKAGQVAYHLVQRGSYSKI